jgi:L-cysteine:1D-myo-inositol 2-amino-2-deoxy-alpha-D-glucopyranoside ligase
MIGLDGEKMSKSKGNLVFVSRLRADGVDPMAVRLALLGDHYRTDRQWTDDVLKAGLLRLARWREAARAEAGPPGGEVLAQLRERLADDLDTPGALAVVDTWADCAVADAGTDPEAPALVAAAVDALLGVRL